MTPAAGRPQTLFGGITVPAEPTRFTLSVFGCRRAWSSAFALVVAEARGVVIKGNRAVILASDATAVEVRADPAGGFLLDPGPLASPPWADQACRLLAEHG